MNRAHPTCQLALSHIYGAQRAIMDEGRPRREALVNLHDARGLILAYAHARNGRMGGVEEEILLNVESHICTVLRFADESDRDELRHLDSWLRREWEDVT